MPVHRSASPRPTSTHQCRQTQGRSRGTAGPEPAPESCAAPAGQRQKARAGDDYAVQCKGCKGRRAAGPRLQLALSCSWLGGGIQHAASARSRALPPQNQAKPSQAKASKPAIAHLLLVRLELGGGSLLQRARQAADGVVVGAALWGGGGGVAGRGVLRAAGGGRGQGVTPAGSRLPSCLLSIQRCCPFTTLGTAWPGEWNVGVAHTRLPTPSCQPAAGQLACVHQQPAHVCTWRPGNTEKLMGPSRSYMMGLPFLSTPCST